LTIFSRSRPSEVEAHFANDDFCDAISNFVEKRQAEAEIETKIIQFEAP